MFKNVKILDSTDSTNTYLKEHSRSFNSPTILFAKTQYHGKGRIGNQWSTTSNGIYASILISEKDLKIESFQLPYISALIVQSFINSFKLFSQIKWPNDILINKKKISGILIEKVDSEYIIGIGININQSLHDFSELNLNATSLSIELNQPFIIEHLYNVFIELFSNKWTYYGESPEKIFIDWTKNSIHSNEIITCRVGSKERTGQFIGLGERGELLLKTSTGVETIWAGEIIE